MDIDVCAATLATLQRDWVEYGVSWEKILILVSVVIVVDIGSEVTNQAPLAITSIGSLTRPVHQFSLFRLLKNFSQVGDVDVDFCS